GVAGEILFEPWEIGIRRAKYMLFTGEKLLAEEAKHYGMVNEIFKDDVILDRVRDIAHKISLLPETTLQLMKKSLNKTQDIMGAKEAFEYHFILHQLGHATDESINLLYKDKTDVKS